jgi:deoxyribonuclease IV
MCAMLPDGRRLGAHLPLGGGMVRAVERAHAIGASAIQIFADNPTAWRRRTVPPTEQGAFRDRLRALDIAPVAIHAPYLVNLAGPDETFFERSVEMLAHELRVAPGFSARFVNVHTGSHRDTSPTAGIARLADGVARVLSQVEPGPEAALLVLENAAGGGFCVGASVEELAEIAEAIARRGIGEERVGFCLDTAHLWGAGYAVSDPDETDRLLDAFDRLLGLRRLTMMHLNDSKAEVGSQVDRHEHIGAGGIGEQGMAHIIRHPRLQHVPTYLETPGMDEGYDAVNVGRVLALARGEALEPLPPGASTVRSSRARSAPQLEPG